MLLAILFGCNTTIYAGWAVYKRRCWRWNTAEQRGNTPNSTHQKSEKRNSSELMVLMFYCPPSPPEFIKLPSYLCEGTSLGRDIKISHHQNQSSVITTEPLIHSFIHFSPFPRWYTVTLKIGLKSNLLDDTTGAQASYLSFSGD